MPKPYKRTSFLSITLSDAEEKRLVGEAIAQNRTKSDLARHLIIEGLDRIDASEKKKKPASKKK